MTLAWAGVGYAYNAWYGQAHTADRLLLALCAVLVWWRPAFVLPFLLVFWPIVHQFDAPSLGFSVLVAEFRPVAHVLTVFVAVLIVQTVRRGRSLTLFLFLTLCLVAADFWVPAWAKVRSGWISHGHLYFLLPNAYTHGWLAFLDDETISAIARTLSAADWPMRLGVLAIEGSALALFASQRAARGLLLAFTALLGLFFLTLGYFFWKWMVLQLALWVMLFRASSQAAQQWRRELFAPGRLVVSMAAIAAAPYWTAPAALAWFDTPVANVIRYEAVGTSGAAFELPPAFFAPYESHIAMGLFAGELTPVPMLASSYGATGSRATADALLRARTPDDVVRLEQAALDGHQEAAEPPFVATFEAFVQRTAEASNRRLTRAGRWRWLDALHPPPFLCTFAHGPAYRGQEPIAAVRLYHVSTFFDGTRYHRYRRIPLQTIQVTGRYAGPPRGHLAGGTGP
jgi:hypothetical protein